MGILNVTPDSFSDGGVHSTVSAAVAHARRMADEGADIIDIGGESTRPTHTPVTAAQEMERVLPVVRAVREALPEMPLSIDTMKAEVAGAAVAAGANLVNDVWGFRHDAAMARTVAAAGVPCCLMHNRAEPVYADLVAEVCADLMESVRLAREAGIPDHQIILDPGIGFGKTREQNLLLRGICTAFAHWGSRAAGNLPQVRDWADPCAAGHRTAGGHPGDDGAGCCRRRGYSQGP
jgi:dihydropteroate synthase